MSSFARRGILGAALGLPFVGRGAFGQEWPARPVRLIVSFAAGGAADTVARAFSATLTEIIGQPIVVENRTGGNALIAANATLQSPADGYTFLVDAANQITNPLLMRDLTFNYERSFLPVSQLARFPQVVAVKAGFPAQSIAAYLDMARAKPGTITYGTPPTAGMGHLTGALLQQRAGIQLIHVPYRGGADAARDISAGSVDSVIITTSSITPVVASNRAKVIAVTSAQRTAAFPEAPTLAESGLPGFDMYDWNGLFAVAGTPRPIIQRLQAAIAQAARSEAVRNRLTPLGAEVQGTGEEEFAAFLAQSRTILARVIENGRVTIN
jgi:tripartite-type tricarboxylate transporter receptor subunit TctC